VDLIELPSPGDGPYRPPTGDDGFRRRAIGWTAALIIVLLVVSVAVLNQHRAGRAASRSQIPSGGSDASPTAPAQGGSGQGSTALVACPQIRDEQSHLGYVCIDNYLRQDGADVSLGLRIELNHEVESGWVISEGSGDPTSVVLPDITTVGYRANHGGGAGGSQASAADVQNEVQRRTALALQQAYGDNPSARTLAGRVRTLAGVPGYELSTEITINPAYRLSQGLRVKTERLWVVGLPSPSGVSIFMLTIPDDRSDLWSKAEAVVGTVHLI
jgi:hypothetical protein